MSKAFQVWWWCLLVFASFSNAGVINGSSFSSINNAQASWTIYSNNPNGYGIFIVFPELQVEMSSLCNFDSIKLTLQTGEIYKICGTASNTYMNYVTTPSTSNSISKNYVLYYPVNWINVTYTSDSSIPSWFMMFYYSDPCNVYTSSSACYSNGCSSYCGTGIFSSFCWNGNYVNYNSTFGVTPILLLQQ